MKILKIIAILSGCTTLAQFAQIISGKSDNTVSVGIISIGGSSATFDSSDYRNFEYGLLAVSALITITATALIIKKKSQ